VPLGAHLTISKGLPYAARLAASVGGDTFGFHTRNPRGGARREIGAEEIAAWRRAQAELGIGAPVGHLPYTINLASDRAIWDFGVRVVGEDLARADAFGAFALVLHPGHAPAGETDAALRRVAEGVRQAVAAAGPTEVLLCLEAMAGQTGELGATPEQLARILAEAGDPPSVAVCLDTCHLFAAGWDIRTQEGIDAMLAAFDAAVGRARIRVLHLNDSVFPLGSHRDRHARLGRGEIGEAGLRAVLTHPFLSTLPTIIETPVDDYAIYAEEIAVARRLREAAA
jgi:deoxyribonuclease-4